MTLNGTAASFCGSKYTIRVDLACGFYMAPCGMSGYHFIQAIAFDSIICRYDEGTAFMPVVQTRRQVPVSDKFRFMGFDEDGYDLPSDW